MDSSVGIAYESFACWFERSFPAWCVWIGQAREAGETPEAIEHTLTAMCQQLGMDLWFVIGARAWMSRRFGTRVYVSAARYN